MGNFCMAIGSVKMMIIEKKMTADCGMHYFFCSTHTPSKRFILLTTYEQDFEPSITNSCVINLISFLTR